jgi:hypothetical protein
MRGLTTIIMMPTLSVRPTNLVSLALRSCGATL